MKWVLEVFLHGGVKNICSIKKGENNKTKKEQKIKSYIWKSYKILQKYEKVEQNLNTVHKNNNVKMFNREMDNTKKNWENVKKSK